MTLPSPTKDLSRAIADIDEYGYCMLADAIDASTAQAVRRRIQQQAQAERDQGFHRLGQVQDVDGINQWVNTLINKGREFESLIDNEKVIKVVEHLLGTEHVLSDFSAHVVRPGSKALPLHIDQWWMPTPLPPGEDYARVSDIDRNNTTHGAPEMATTPINPPCVVNAFWAISEFTRENGATRLVPRSHLSGKQPPLNTVDEDFSVPLIAPAGTCTIWEGRTWHGAGSNRSNAERFGVTTYYGGPQFRSLTNFTLSTKPEIVENASPRLRQLLGYKVWNEYGRTGETADGYALPIEAQIGELTPEQQIED